MVNQYRKDMQLKNIFILSCIFVLSKGMISAQQITAFVTNADLSKKLSPLQLKFGEPSSVCDHLYIINAVVDCQTIEGFGAALTGSSALVLNYLDEKERTGLLKNIFDPDSGSGFNYLRISIGASDFSAYNWTHTRNDNRTFEFKDPEGVVPILQTVKSINPGLKIMASLWSPPAYMKKNTESLVGGSFDPAKGRDLADYFIRFINEMDRRNLKVDAVTIQNEPLYNTAKYMCMYMSAEQQRDFIKNDFGRRLFNNNKKRNLRTGLYVYDHNWDHAFDYVNTIYQDKSVRKYVAGAAFHAYNGNVSEQTRVKNLDYSKDILLTEITGHTTSDGTPEDFIWAMNNTVIGNLQNYGSGLIYWNLALDTNGGNGHFGPVAAGGPTNCRGVIDINKKTKAVRYNVEFYAIAHAGKIIRPGAKRIDSGAPESNGVKQVAFINPDDSRAMILFNNGDSDKKIAVKDGDRYINLTLEAKNVISLRWSVD